jgi:large-conductance mechanosensitive channel
MASFRDEAKKDFLNALKAIVFEGSPRDWFLTMILLAIPIAIALNLSAILDSLINNFLMPMIFYPILNSMAIGDLTSWRIGWFRIGAFIGDFINFCLNLAILLGLARFLRRLI